MKFVKFSTLLGYCVSLSSDFIASKNDDKDFNFSIFFSKYKGRAFLHNALY